jgi:uncharacterized membrane protein
MVNEGGLAMADVKDTTTNVTENVDVGVAVSYVATLFDTVDDAKKAYQNLKEAQREGLIRILDAAYVEKTDRSKIKVHDHDDWKVGEGVVAGGITGAVIGIVGGAILLPVAIGALVGGIVTEVYEKDVKFTNKEIKELADSLPPGTSALIAIVEDVYVEDVKTEMTKQGGKKVHSGAVPKSTADSLTQSKTDSKNK